MVARIVSALSRVTTSGRVIREIDGLRFIAITLVVMHHLVFLMREQPHLGDGVLGAVLAGIGERGGIGVQLFFGISGFILALPFAEAALGTGQKVRLKRYFLRRLTRLEPPYIINLLVLFSLALLRHGQARYGRVPHLLASIGYVHNLVYGQWSEINFVAWSLEIEVQFYLAAPLLALVFRIRSPSLRRTVIAVGMLVCSLLATDLADASYRVRSILPFHLHFFLVGFLLADLYTTRRWKHADRSAPWADPIATLAIVGVMLAWSHPSLKQFTFPGILLFYACVLRSRVWRQALSFKPVAIYGGMCYTAYLYHFWIMRPVVASTGSGLCTALPGGLGLFLLVVLSVLVVGAASTPLFLLFEKPFMYSSWPQWVSQRVRAMARREARD